MASISGPPSAGPDAKADIAARQVKSAEAMVECLAGLGLAAEASTGSGTVGYEGLELREVWPVLDDGGAFNLANVGGTTTEGARKAGIDFDISETGLFVGGQDRTADFLACIEQTGYFMPNPDFDPAEEERRKQEFAQAGNVWAACARENGLPALADVTVVVDNWATKPVVTVDSSTDSTLFKSVLEKCPPFSPDRDLSHGNVYEADEPVPTDPIITFTGNQDDPDRVALEVVLDNFTTKALDDARRAD